MKRREFISIGGAAWRGRLLHARSNLTACAARRTCGHRERCGRTGTLRAFQQGLQHLGWILSRNVQIDYRFGGGDADNIRKHARISLLAPDVILAGGGAAAGPFLQARTVHCIRHVPDPVGAASSIVWPAAAMRQDLLISIQFSAKWLELLKAIAPSVTRAAVLRDAFITAGTGQFGASSGGPSFGVEVSLSTCAMLARRARRRGLCAFFDGG